MKHVLLAICLALALRAAPAQAAIGYAAECHTAISNFVASLAPTCNASGTDLVALITWYGNTNPGTFTTVTYGGVTATDLGGDPGSAWHWWIVDGIPSGSQTVQVTWTNSQTNTQVAVAVYSGAIAANYGTVGDNDGGAGAGASSISYATTVADAWSIGWVFTSNGAGYTAGAGVTARYNGGAIGTQDSNGSFASGATVNQAVTASATFPFLVSYQLWPAGASPPVTTRSCFGLLGVSCP